MTGGPAEGLYVATGSPAHGMPAQVKVVALTAFVLSVVATPATAYWAFGLYAAALAGVTALAKLPPATVVRRLAVELPFVVFALLLPFVAGGPRIEVLGLSLSEAGVLGGWNLLAKGTLGVLAAVLLSATTTPRELLTGLERLRLPAVLVAILSFMIRYISVVSGDLQRMRIARESRAAPSGRAGQLRAVATGAGALFVRSYERGERVHLAMLARGYTGTMPALSQTGARRTDWARGLTLPLAALLVSVASRTGGLR